MTEEISTAMSRSEAGLIIFASLLMAAIVMSYVCQGESLQGVGPFAWGGTASSLEAHLRLPDITMVTDDKYEDWRPPKLPERLRKAEQQDPELISHIRTSWILGPPQHSLRRLIHPEKYDHSEYGQSFVVDKLLHGREDGFFVDVWAGNGETDSNTLFMEKDRHWSGLLIEPDPSQFRRLAGKRRQGYLLQACVSPTTQPSILNLTYGEDLEFTTLVQCFPLYSIIQALDIKRVDYLSIRSQHELEILKTLPANSPFTIETITIETHVDNQRRESMAKNEAVKTLMTSQGYRWVDAGDRINRKNVILQLEHVV